MTHNRCCGCASGRLLHTGRTSSLVAPEIPGEYEHPLESPSRHGVDAPLNHTGQGRDDYDTQYGQSYVERGSESLHRSPRSEDQSLRPDGTPKRPLNAFIIFCKSRRSELAQTPGACGRGEISTILSREWRSMPSAQKQLYLDQAKAMKASYDSKYPDRLLSYRRHRRQANPRQRSEEEKIKDELTRACMDMLMRAFEAGCAEERKLKRRRIKHQVDVAHANPRHDLPVEVPLYDDNSAPLRNPGNSDAFTLRPVSPSPPIAPQPAPLHTQTALPSFSELLNGEVRFREYEFGGPSPTSNSPSTAQIPYTPYPFPQDHTTTWLWGHHQQDVLDYNDQGHLQTQAYHNPPVNRNVY